MAAEKTIRILVAEDNVINQLVIRRMLEHEGYAVSTVNNGGEVIGALQAEHHDLVIMDCLMPVMDGYAATRAIRASRSDAFDPQTPILAITALAAPRDQEKCLAAGMSACITKPVNAKQLFPKLRELLTPGQKHAAAEARTDTQDRPTLVADILLSMSDRLLDELVEWRARLSALAEAHALTELGHLAHTIRGMADVLGEAILSRAALELETAAREGQSEPAFTRSTRLVVELHRLELSVRNQAMRQAPPPPISP